MHSHMEETPGRSVSFKTQHQSTNTVRNGKLESRRRADQCSLQRRETLSPSSSSSCCSSLGIPHSPIRAMEFLSRSWSPSAYNFQQMFPSSINMFPSHEEKLDDEFSFEGPDEKLETEAIQFELPPESSRRSTFSSRTSRVDNIWTNTKGWLGGESITSLLRRNKAKKKEDVRLQTASIHAALSVTRLAAAIASVAATKSSIDSESESAQDIGNQGTVLQSRNNIDDIFASAAALVTTVCAEAAESLGAQTIDVSSAINSGWATQTTGDMITLTADAATRLRGVAALRARAKADAYFPRTQNFLPVKAELSVVTPSGSKRYGWASIYSKHSQLILSLQKKHLGFLATTTEYKILHVVEGTREVQGNLSISLRSNSGYIKLLFKDENQSLVWMTSISSLLQLH
ncbi:VAN3-binding protein [Rosa chinensis]|uniref:VAN3-binding protein n=1 Tax=Rosa chinensis TaxID=74649 RepID=UPI000D08E47A|nr:VAN3-binding protein [Rosa chinensis]